MPVTRHLLRREARDQQQLLALSAVRTGLESKPAGRFTATPVGPVIVIAMTRDSRAIIADLTELIEAIDRRSPQLQRNGEGAIATAAMRLRDEARLRIAELERATGVEAVSPVPAGLNQGHS